MSGAHILAVIGLAFVVLVRPDLFLLIAGVLYVSNAPRGN
jgi:hypothetical protein